jgi:hypothetical protein
VGCHKAILSPYFYKHDARRQAKVCLFCFFATFIRFLEEFKRFVVDFLLQMHHLGSQPELKRLYVNAKPDIALNFIVLHP